MSKYQTHQSKNSFSQYTYTNKQFSYSQDELDYNNAMQRATRIATGQLLPADIPIEDLIEDEDIRDLTGETEVMIAPVFMHFQKGVKRNNNNYTIVAISLVRHPKFWKDNDVHHMPLEMHRFVDVYSDGNHMPTIIQHEESVAHLHRLVKNYARIYTLMGYEVSIPVAKVPKEPSEAEQMGMSAGLAPGFAPSIHVSSLPDPFPEVTLYRPHREEERPIQALSSKSFSAFVDNIHTAMTSQIGSKTGGINSRDKRARLEELGVEFTSTDDRAQPVYIDKSGMPRRSAMMWNNGAAKAPDGRMLNPCGEIDL